MHLQEKWFAMCPGEAWSSWKGLACCTSAIETESHIVEDTTFSDIINGEVRLRVMRTIYFSLYGLFKKKTNVIYFDPHKLQMNDHICYLNLGLKLKTL